MKKIVSILMIISFFVGLGYGEKVVMNDGKEYVGNIHHQDDNVVYIVQKEDLIKLNRADVKEIVKEDNSQKKNGTFIDNLDKDDPENKNSEIILQVGYDFYGKYLHKGTEDSATSINGLTFGAKYYHYLIDVLGLGIGANIQTSRDLKNIPGKVYFLPTYVSLKLRSNPTQPYKYGYIAGNIGYNFFFPDSDYTSYIENQKGGLFYSIGLGIVYNHILVEVTAAVHNGSARLKSTSYNIDLEYRTYTISIGYVF